MSIETAIRELDEICEFLNGHPDISHATYKLTHENITVIIETSSLLPGLNTWLEHIEQRLESIFGRPATYEIKTNYADTRKTEKTQNEEPENPRKLVNKITYIFSSFDSKYRLLRLEAEKKQYESEDTYYQENKDISEREIKSINSLFQIAVEDYKAGKFVTNFIEVNINNASSPEVLSKFSFIFKQIPKQFADRFVLSLVRIPINENSDFTNKAIESFKQIIPTVFISMELDTYLTNQNKVNDFFCDGYIITAGNPQRKDIAGMLRKANFNQIAKQVFVIYYTRDWKEIPSNNQGVVPMYMKSKLEDSK